MESGVKPTQRDCTACPESGGSAVRPRGRPRSFDRNTVLDRAMQTFWRLGYEGASIADLTTAVRITPQSLYAAFGSKSVLYREALAFYQEPAATNVIIKSRSAHDPRQ